MDKLREALEHAKGTLGYISTQAKLNHGGFNMVAKQNAEMAINKINVALTADAPTQSDEDCAREILGHHVIYGDYAEELKRLIPIIAAHRTQAATGWLPIEDCPKEARKLYLVYGPWAGEINGIDSGDCGPFVAEYGGDKYQGDYEGFKWIVSGTDGYAAWCKPTHYMPLPAAPAALNTEKEEK